MKMLSLRNALASILLVALAACGGGGSTGSAPLVPVRGPQQPQQPDTILSTIVGVGDSLTAGYQSNGFLGETGVKNPFFHGHQIPPNQENGFWADLVEQASGDSIPSEVAKMYDPAKSPLPLIKGPGLDNQVVPYDFPFFSFIQLKSGNVCADNNGFNEAGYRLKGLARVRMNPNSTTIRDFGVPGLTLHEANTLHAPQSSTCKSLPGIPGLLNQVIAEESGTFWPVLGNFAKLPHLTDVNAAVSRHPTLATVWLGANDVLKYMGSGGRFVGGDRNAGQAESDLRQSITALQHAGARVVTANLPNIVETGFFQRVTIPKNFKECSVQTYAICVLTIAGDPPSVVNELARKFHLATPGGCVPASTTKPCGYLTLPAIPVIINYFQTYYGGTPNLDCAVPKPNCKPVAGSGLGIYYITPEFAGKVQALNDAINQGIDNAARSTNVPLVDVHAIFQGLASGSPSNPYFREAASINPGKCCTTGYLWGIFSFDGIHPSNTGYALIANNFIKAINRAYGTHISDVDLQAVYDGSRCSDKAQCYPDPYGPPHDHPYSP